MTRYNLKMAMVKGIDGGQNYSKEIWCSFTWLKKKVEIFEAIERQDTMFQKKRKRMKTITYEELDSAMYI